MLLTLYSFLQSKYLSLFGLSLNAVIRGVHSVRPRFVQEFIVLRWGILEVLVLNLRNVAVVGVEHIKPRIPHHVWVDESIKCECLVLLFWSLNQLESLMSICLGHIISESQLLCQ